MKASSGMHNKRTRALAALKVVGITMALSFAAPLTGGFGPALASEALASEGGPRWKMHGWWFWRTCDDSCPGHGYCCVPVGAWATGGGF